jgi:hypothetical protein
MVSKPLTAQHAEAASPADDPEPVVHAAQAYQPVPAQEGAADDAADSDGGSNAGEQAADESEWRGSEFVELVPLCNHVWGLATPDENGLVDGGQIRPLMLMSQLPMDSLAEIWGLADTEQNGAVRHILFEFI